MKEWLRNLSHFSLKGRDGAVRLLLQVLCQKAMMDFQSNGGEA